MPRISLITQAVLSVVIALASYRFLALGMELSFPDLLAHLDQRRVAFIAHVSAAPVALLLGSLQFFSRGRARWPRLHRVNGRIYALAVLVGGVSGLLLAVSSVGGPVAATGFAALSLLWLFTTARAVRLAMAGSYAAHRRWMMRSFALTFAGVMLRLYLPGFMLSGLSYAQAAPYLAWMCWVPNLLFVEWLMRRSPRGGGELAGV